MILHTTGANGGNGRLVETTPSGHQIAMRTVDRSGSPQGAGALFGLAFAGPLRLYFVDDATNTLMRLGGEASPLGPRAPPPLRSGANSLTIRLSNGSKPVRAMTPCLPRLPA